MIRLSMDDGEFRQAIMISHIALVSCTKEDAESRCTVMLTNGDNIAVPMGYEEVLTLIQKNQVVRTPFQW
jgi:hypothetical protein